MPVSIKYDRCHKNLLVDRYNNLSGNGGSCMSNHNNYRTPYYFYVFVNDGNVTFNLKPDGKVIYNRLRLHSYINNPGYHDYEHKFGTIYSNNYIYTFSNVAADYYSAQIGNYKWSSYNIWEYTNTKPVVVGEGFTIDINSRYDMPGTSFKYPTGVVSYIRTFTNKLEAAIYLTHRWDLYVIDETTGQQKYHWSSANTKQARPKVTFSVTLDSQKRYTIKYYYWFTDEAIFWYKGYVEQYHVQPQT